jgi:hypothetical protein
MIAALAQPVGAVSSIVPLAFPGHALSRGLAQILIAFPLMLIALPQAQSEGITIRSKDGIATGPCGTITANLRPVGSTGIRVMGISKQRATITITSDTAGHLATCPTTTKTCYATWLKRNMRSGQHVVTIAARNPSNCVTAISLYMDVQ